MSSVSETHVRVFSSAVAAARPNLCRRALVCRRHSGWTKEPIPARRLVDSESPSAYIWCAQSVSLRIRSLQLEVRSSRKHFPSQFFLCFRLDSHTFATQFTILLASTLRSRCLLIARCMRGHPSACGRLQTPRRSAHRCALHFEMRLHSRCNGLCESSEPGNRRSTLRWSE